MFLLECYPFDFWHPSKWMADQTNNVINFFAAAGTVGALGYALWKDRVNSKKINDLAEIATAQNEQNKLIVAQNKLLMEQNKLQRLAMRNDVWPDLVASPSYSGGTGQLEIIVQNERKDTKAIIQSVQIVSDEIQWTPFTNQGQTLKWHQRLSIIGQRPYGSHTIEDMKYTIIIKFIDVLGNPYLMVIKGNGNSIEHDSQPEDEPTN
ncbi:MAG: hypothetical protein EOP49_00830 [Sphingobacteriales bacterium]|nr:MAG: hypothetical protein EOP49_00830 [Sphingobacteriales bacterium]